MEVPSLNVDVDLTPVLSQAGHGHVPRHYVVPYHLRYVERSGIRRGNATHFTCRPENIVSWSKQGHVGTHGLIEKTRVDRVLDVADEFLKALDTETLQQTLTLSCI